MTEMPNLGTKSNFSSAVDNCRWIGEILGRCLVNLNRYGLSAQRSLAGIQYLQHLHTISAIGARCSACDNAFNEVLTFFPEWFFGGECYRLTFSLMRYR